MGRVVRRGGVGRWLQRDTAHCFVCTFDFCSAFRDDVRNTGVGGAVGLDPEPLGRVVRTAWRRLTGALAAARIVVSRALAGPTAASSVPGAATACMSAQLAVTLGQRQQAMNQPAIAIIFTNVSVTPCTLYGYPGVTGLDAHGRQLVQAYRIAEVYMGGAPGGVAAEVTVTSGGQASALIGGTAQPVNGEATCTADYAAFLVIPPGTSAPSKLSVDFPSCTGLAVTPVVPGPTGGLF